MTLPDPTAFPMTMTLDARQRAMLQEMGITVWAPPATPPAVVKAPGAAPAPHAMPAPVAAARPVMPTTQTEPQQADTSAPPAPASTRSATPAAAPTLPPQAATSPPALTAHAPQRLYAVDTPPPQGLGRAWLVITESATPQAPLSGDAGKLLDNMLRAMQLHQHPEVFFCALERPRPGQASHSEGDADPASTLAHAVRTVQPAMVLVLGHVAARIALGRTEPLGRLRAELHQLVGHPALVTYDPAFLLRSQDTKAAAWADLCRALALVRNA